MQGFKKLVRLGGREAIVRQRHHVPQFLGFADQKIAHRPGIERLAANRLQAGAHPRAIARIGLAAGQFAVAAVGIFGTLRELEEVDHHERTIVRPAEESRGLFGGRK